MKQLNLLLACMILLGISGICFYIILWIPTGMQNAIGLTLLLYNSFWGKIFFIANGFICLSCGLALLAHFMGLDADDRPHIVIEQEGGTVGVSMDAIEEFLKRKGLSVDGVKDLSVRAQMTDEGISLRTRVTLELQRNMPEFIQAFQGRMNHELVNTLGLKKVKEIQVLIHKILSKEGSDGRLLGPPSPVLLKEPSTLVKTANPEEPPIMQDTSPEPGIILEAECEFNKEKEESQ